LFAECQSKNYNENCIKEYFFEDQEGHYDDKRAFFKQSDEIKQFVKRLNEQHCLQNYLKESISLELAQNFDNIE